MMQGGVLSVLSTMLAKQLRMIVWCYLWCYRLVGKQLHMVRGQVNSTGVSQIGCVYMCMCYCLNVHLHTRTLSSFGA